METFTIEEVLFLVLIGVIVISLIVCMIKGLFRLAIGIFIAFVLFGFGFGWLPEQLELMNSGEKTAEEIAQEALTKDTLDESFSISEDYYNENKDGLFAIAQSALDKILNSFSDDETEVE